MEDQHAKAIKKGVGTAGQILTADFTVSIGTKKGRWCRECCRLWQAWSAVCPKCEQPTEPAE